MKTVKVAAVEFDRCPAHYRPNDTVTASVTLQLRWATKIAEISVRILGRSVVRWTEKRKNGEGKWLKIPCQDEETHLDATVNLSGYAEKYSGGKLRSGDHRLPFSFTLPAEIPSSFKGKSAAEISYVCQLNLVAVKSTHSQLVTEPFQVSCPPPPDYFSPPQEISDSLQLTSCFRRSGSIDVRIGLDRRHFTPGEEILVALMVNNRSTKSVGILRSSLLALTVYRGRRPDGTTWEEREKPKSLAQKTYAGQLVPGDIFNLSELAAVTVPKDLAPLSVENCRNIRLSYVLRVRLADRFHFDLPVYISSL